MHLVVQNSIARSERRNGGTVISQFWPNLIEIVLLIQWNVDVKKGQRTGKLSSLWGGFLYRGSFPYILLLLRRRISFVRSLCWAVRYIVVPLYTLCIKIVAIRSSISPGVPCWAFSNCIQSTENSFFRYKLALFNFYNYTILERPQWVKSFSIACADPPPPLRIWGGVCTQANFRLLHITLRRKTEKSQRWDMNQKYRKIPKMSPSMYKPLQI